MRDRLTHHKEADSNLKKNLQGFAVTISLCRFARMLATIYLQFCSNQQTKTIVVAFNAVLASTSLLLLSAEHPN